jgi:hypothetical protein
MLPWWAVTAVLVFAFVLWVLVKIVRSSGGPGGYAKLSASGKPGLGILLRVGPTGTRLGQFETRTVLIDVEVPGEPPYEANVPVSFPVSLKGDVLPGATVEVRVDPKDPNKIAIVGPGVGFAGQFAARPS